MKCIRNMVLMSALVLTLACAFASVCWADDAVTLQQCKDAIAAHDYAQAADLCRQVLSGTSGSESELVSLLSETVASVAKEDTARRSLMYVLVECYRRLKQWDDAQALCKSVLADYPDEAGRVESERATIALYQMKDSVESMPKDDPLRKELMYKLALAYRNKGNYDDALSLYKSISEDYTGEDVACCIEIARTYVAKGDIDKAISTCMDTAAKLGTDPKAAEALFYAAEVQSGHGKASDAVATLDKICADYPDSAPLALVRKGEALGYYLNDADGAVSAWRKVISDYESDPNAKEALSRLADFTLFKLNKGSDARSLYAQLLSKYPECDNALTAYNLACCSFAEEYWSEAKSSFEAVYGKCVGDPVQAAAKYKVGECCAMLGDTNGARDAFQTVVADLTNPVLAKAAQERLDGLTNAGN